MEQRKSRIEEVPAGDLKTDPRVNTRLLSAKWVDQREGNFALSKLGVITVSERTGEGAGLFMIDGQHRRELAIRVGGRKSLVPCQIYEGLTLAEEADMFLALNDERKPDAVAKFLARVTAGDIACAQVAEIVSRYGWTISPDRSVKGAITCVVKLEQIHRNDKARGRPPLALEKTIRVITEAWAPGLIPARNGNGRVDPLAGHQSLIAGIGLIFLKNGDAVDVARLTGVLAGWPLGPSGLHSKAQGLQGIEGGIEAKCVYKLVKRPYDKNLRTRRLADLS